ncbi:hypothetical protein HD554DRAFT_2013506 [Boletus coccyginus]|nr:hypothetical protein HD554DRAFT_2013506 [Boletus coccyginus]
MTSAAQGIDRAISLRLSSDGSDVAINDIQSNKVNLDAVGAEITTKGRGTMQILADVSDEVLAKGTIDHLVEVLGGLDVVRTVITNAGNCRVDTLLDTDLDNRDANVVVIAKGTFLCFKYEYAVKQMIAQGRGGRLIGASSLPGKIDHTGPLDQIAYYSAHSTNAQVSRGKGTFGRHGITVNSYAPGAIATVMLESSRLADEQQTCSPGRFLQYCKYASDVFRRAPRWWRTLRWRIDASHDVKSLISYLVTKKAVSANDDACGVRKTLLNAHCVAR